MERIHFGNLRIASLLLTDHMILLVFNQSKTFSMHWSPLPSTSSDQSQHLQVWDYGSSGKWWNASSGWRRGLPQAREFLTREFEYVWFLFTYGRKSMSMWWIGVLVWLQQQYSGEERLFNLPVHLYSSLNLWLWDLDMSKMQAVKIMSV